MTQQITLPREIVEQLIEVASRLLAMTALNSSEAPMFHKALTAGRAALANAEPTGCQWTQDPDFEMGDTYHSACGDVWSFTDGGPADNNVRYCHGCGKPVTLIKEIP